MGVYQDSGTVLSFQMGDTPSALHRMPSVNDYDSILPWCDMQYSTLNGFNVLCNRFINTLVFVMRHSFTGPT